MIKPLLIAFGLSIILSQPADAGILGGIVKFPFRCAASLLRLPVYILDGNFAEWKRTG